MALYHLSVKPVSRGGGRSAVATAAYRSAEELHDARQGVTHDYTRKQGVDARLLMMADGAGELLTMEGAGWTAERERLWNAAEAAEKRKDARVGREYEVALPCELDREGRRELVRAFAGELVSRFGVAVDAAIHAPGREGDARNWHAHVLATTRQAIPGGMGEKAAIELSDTARGKLGLGKAADEIEALRAVWAGQVNRALERARVAERVDHRSYARQGVGRAAEQHLGPGAAALERQAARQARERAPEATAGPEAAAAASVTASVAALVLPAALARVSEAQGQPGEANETVAGVKEQSATGAAVPKFSPGGQGPQAARTGLERPRTAQERVAVMRPVSPTDSGREAAVRPSVGFFGAGSAPVTRIGQRNAEIREQNRAVEAARAAVVQAQRVLAGLERAVRRMVELARGLGVQAVEAQRAREREAERQRQERERVELERRAEMEWQERAQRRAAEQAPRQSRGPSMGM